MTTRIWWANPPLKLTTTRTMKKLLYPLGCLLALTATSQAGLFYSDDFSTFTPGALVGQQSWAQLGANAASPLQIGGTGPQLLLPGGLTAAAQNAIKTFTFVPAPASGTALLYQGMVMTMNSIPAGKTTGYITALQDTSAGFANIRLAAQDDTANLGFYKLAARVTGQSGAPWAYGAYDLSYSTAHRIIIEANMVAGAQNDFIRVFVDPTSLDLASQTPYLTATVTVGSNETDPTGLGGFVISQYGSATTPSEDAAIGMVAMGDTFGDVAAALGVVPEPSTFALIGLGLAGLVLRYRRQ